MLIYYLFSIPLNLASIHGIFLTIIPVVLPSGDSVFLTFPLYIVIGILLERKDVSFPFMYLIIYIRVDTYISFILLNYSLFSLLDFFILLELFLLFSLRVIILIIHYYHYFLVAHIVH